MKLLNWTFATATAFLTATHAQANPVLECSQTADNNVEVGRCLAEIEKTANAVVEQTLGYAMIGARELDDVTGRVVAVPALEAGQNAWLEYRDKHCEFIGATFGGGSGTGAAIRECRIELSRERAGVLLENSQ